MKIIFALVLVGVFATSAIVSYKWPEWEMRWATERAMVAYENGGTDAAEESCKISSVAMYYYRCSFSTSIDKRNGRLIVEGVVFQYKSMEDFINNTPDAMRIVGVSRSVI